MNLLSSLVNSLSSGTSNFASAASTAASIPGNAYSAAGGGGTGTDATGKLVDAGNQVQDQMANDQIAQMKANAENAKNSNASDGINKAISSLITNGKGIQF